MQVHIIFAEIKNLYLAWIIISNKVASSFAQFMLKIFVCWQTFCYLQYKNIVGWKLEVSFKDIGKNNVIFVVFFLALIHFPSSVKLRNKTDWNFSTWTSIISSTVNSVFLCYGVVSKAPSYKNMQTLLIIFFPWLTPPFNNLDDHLKEIKIKMKLVENDLSQENTWTSLSELWKKKGVSGLCWDAFLV